MEERVAIVTGASSGIGWAVARLAARRGWRVVVAARRAERLEALAARIREAGGTALVVPADVAALADQERLVAEALRAFGRIDALVNNAGLPLSTPFHATDPAELRRQWDVNVTALATLTRIALPHLEARGGTVINVGSVIGRVAVPGWGNYSATKVAVAALTDALRPELQARGVRVCLVEPGPIRTEFYQRSGGESNPAPPRSLTAMTAAAPIVRLLDHPRRRITIPGWLSPILTVVGALAHAAPGLTDAVLTRREARDGRT
jgi:uncharacterized protein